MNLKSLRAHISKKPGVKEETPFGPDVLVPKVGGKMFATIAWTQDPLRVNLKGDPFLNEILREEWEAVLPGYHMNKVHWNTVVLDGTVPDKEIKHWVDASYDLVFASLTKKAQVEIMM
jgi:predicted DNA-binding protein (MmcQ/YjbR family)